MDETSQFSKLLKKYDESEDVELSEIHVSFGGSMEHAEKYTRATK